MCSTMIDYPQTLGSQCRSRISASFQSGLQHSNVVDSLKGNNRWCPSWSQHNVGSSSLTTSLTNHHYSFLMKSLNISKLLSLFVLGQEAGTLSWISWQYVFWSRDLSKGMPAWWCLGLRCPQCHLKMIHLPAQRSFLIELFQSILKIPTCLN
jgi:hypothetical protein